MSLLFISSILVAGTVLYPLSVYLQGLLFVLWDFLKLTWTLICKEKASFKKISMSMWVVLLGRWQHKHLTNESKQFIPLRTLDSSNLLSNIFISIFILKVSDLFPFFSKVWSIWSRRSPEQALSIPGHHKQVSVKMKLYVWGGNQWVNNCRKSESMQRLNKH